MGTTLKFRLIFLDAYQQQALEVSDPARGLAAIPHRESLFRVTAVEEDSASTFHRFADFLPEQVAHQRQTSPTNTPVFSSSIQRVSSLRKLTGTRSKMKPPLAFASFRLVVIRLSAIHSARDLALLIIPQRRGRGRVAVEIIIGGHVGRAERAFNIGQDPL